MYFVLGYVISILICTFHWNNMGKLNILQQELFMTIKIKMIIVYDVSELNYQKQY